jgi:hypothetical protein
MVLHLSGLQSEGRQSIAENVGRISDSVIRHKDEWE